MNACLAFYGSYEAKEDKGILLQKQCENANSNAVGQLYYMYYSPVPHNALTPTLTSSSIDYMNAYLSANF
jgi:hypothetical protein